ncbi:MAG: DNA topoisomerase IB [Verrucomicrobiota bacterium]
MKLIYTTDQMPGYKRVRRGKGFSFVLPDGVGFLIDKAERKRILSLAIPPAYENVWICPLPNGHLQATGIDARQRKQYRYHPAWHESAADRKFEMLGGFAAALPRIRAALRKELAGTDLTRDRVISGIVALLDLTGYRIGNSRYVKDNNTFGLSTLRTRHLKEDRGQLKLRFRGKAGHEHRAEVADRRLTRLVRDLQELPGQHLFCYEDESGICHDIGTTDVNDWLKLTGGGEYTAKQFRTWRATVMCARKLAEAPPPAEIKAQDRVVREAIRETARSLNHTEATCRKYYIHPGLIASFASGSLYRIMNAPAPRLRKSDGTAGLHADERRLYKILSDTRVVASSQPG